MNNIEYIRLLNSNKFSIKEKKLLFVGIISNTIVDKTLFKKNSDLKEYISFYEKSLNKAPYKDYLYDSRTLLNARLIKDFISTQDNFIIKQCFKFHIDFIENNETVIKNNKQLKDEREIESKNNNLLSDMINRSKDYE